MDRIWDCIHIFSKTFEPTQEMDRNCFVCFFQCIQDLLPDKMYQSYFSSFMVSAPPQYYLISQDTAFEWTFKLRLAVILAERKRGNAVPLLTLSQLKQKYEFITKDDWSQAVWFVMHFLTANLPQQMNDDTKMTVKAFCVCLRHLLPCPKCKAHMEIYLSEHQVDRYMKSPLDVFRWTCEYHDAVNQFDTSHPRPKLDYEHLYQSLRVRNDSPSQSQTNFVVLDEEF